MTDAAPRKGFWNLPNTLTVLRILLVPVMVWILWDEPTVTECTVACAIFVGAMITDIVDGYLARKWNLVSPVGAYLDPLADKLMVTTTLIMLIPLGRAPAWMVALLLCRELAITALRGIASQEGMVMSAGTGGKLKTAYQGTAVGMILWFNPFMGIDVYSAGIITLWIATAMAVWSGVQYFREFIQATTLTA